MDNNNEENMTFGSPIDNGKTKDLKKSIDEMQTFLDEPSGGKGSKAMLIVFIITIVLFLALGGFFIYNYFFNGTKCKAPVVKASSSDKYSVYLDNIKERDYAEYITFNYRENDEDKKKEFVLGTDNTLYILNNDEEITIPGAKGNGGELKGKSTDITSVIRIFKVNHTNGTGNIEDEREGLLILKENGDLTIIRNIEKDSLKEENLDSKYIIDAYIPLDNISKTILVDIDGKTSILK